ncbi:DUF6272 family protein [Spirulina subsalsa FACHB-351]|uniref:DUF6272 family protein n=1 Tax=Spirulina subsalsa FACHB-351 TaxID=234711 RepID=A0ABT3L2C6_9CYAN|nr:DUF6272 family protein [Spirulina subsalsa]MCW6035661.1 DUF6272 family protein [Spirulina subsalsa FACHB-351]
MSKVFGHFLNTFPPDHDSLELNFRPSSKSIKERWRNNRLSAYFVANYFSTFVGSKKEDKDHERQLKEGKAAVSYIANELLENAVKFHDEPESSTHTIRFGIHFIENQLITAVIFATNVIKTDKMKPFEDWIQELLSVDTEELYIKKVEESLENDEQSGVGLLTIINDYDARLGWYFEEVPEDPTICFVTTMAQVTIE